MIFRKIFLAAIALMFMVLPEICSASIHDYPKVGVIPFTKKAAVSPDINLEDQTLVTGKLYEELLLTGKFDLLERENMSDIMDEQMLQLQMGNPASIVQTFNIEGAEYLLVGSIDGLSSKKRVNEVVGFGSNSYTVVARLSARLIDVETSRVALAATSVAESTVRLTKAPLRIIRIGGNEINGDQVIDALEKSAVVLVRNLMTNMERMKQTSGVVKSANATVVPYGFGRGCPTRVGQYHREQMLREGWTPPQIVLGKNKKSEEN